MYDGSLEPPVTCPHCGASVSAAADRCSACSRAVRGPQVAAGVLTPPPVPTPDSDDDETRFIEPQATQNRSIHPDPEATRFELDPDATRFELDPDATRFEPDPDATRFEPDPDATRFVPSDPDPDETRFVDPDVTRMVLEPSRPQAERPPTPRPTTRPPTGGRSRSGARTSEGATGPLDVGQAFGERYHIIRVLGIGGMGAVYHAWDAELGMAVALKVIRPDSSSDPQAAAEMERRFKQELVLARQVTHKNVVRIHDLGEIDGIKYITMPYLEGSDLSTVLKETGKMPVPRALGIIRDVSAGLVAAHEVGIVHRDLKPANIMVLKDHAVIMDFGIARSNQLPQEASAHLAPAEAIDSLKSAVAKTLVGTILGTVQYMAPEQAKGLDVDQRADIYALGLIFLDMLLGKRHTHASSAIEELKARIEQPPPLAQTLDPSIPKPIEEVIARCLEPDREKRYQTSADLVAALDRLDDKGELIPIKRVVRMPLVVAIASALLALSGYIYWTSRPPLQHDPVSVVITDLQNTTGDAAFDHTLEPILKVALEEAQFVSAYDRLEIRRTLGIPPSGIPAVLNEAAGRTLAVNQGVGVVLSGALSHVDSRYTLSMRAVEAVTGNEIASVQARTSNRDEVLAVATQLASRIRKTLGDDPSDSERRFAQQTLSATSLDVIGAYARGWEAVLDGKYNDALKNFSKAVALDDKFGLAYTAMAAVSRNLGREDDADKYMKQAIAHLDGMTERERYRTRALSYALTGDYKACASEYRELITRYSGDAASRNNFALCSAYLRDWPRALEELKRLVSMLPKRNSYRENLATYLSYAGEFQQAEEAARKESGVYGLLALAFAQIGQNKIREAADSYEALGRIDAQGASYRSSGLADIAAYEGRFSDAARILRAGATADTMNAESGRAARKLVDLAQTYVRLNDKGRAIRSAMEALAASQAPRIRFLAARVFVAVGDFTAAEAIAKDLTGQFQAEPQAYGKIIDAEIAIEKGNARQAVTTLTEANTLFDTWLGHFDLGRAYLSAGAALQASGEFDRCVQRRGEAISLFLDEEPSYSYFPDVYYYQGRVREELKNGGFAEFYGKYIEIRGGSKEDALLSDARTRARR